MIDVREHKAYKAFDSEKNRSDNDVPSPARSIPSVRCESELIDSHRDHNMRPLESIFSDSNLNMEIYDLIDSGNFPILKTLRLNHADLAASLDHLWALDTSELFEIEAAIIAFGRPIIAISDGSFHSKSTVLQSRLMHQVEPIRRTMRRVGEVQLKSLNSTHKRSCGTGWFVSPKIIVTTKEVANMIQMERTSCSLSPQIEMCNELDCSSSYTIPVQDIVYKSSEFEGNFVFIRTAEALQDDFSSLSFDDYILKGSNIACIGYPSRDDALTRSVSNLLLSSEDSCKAISPGRITEVNRFKFDHDCSVTTTNSGSIIVQLDTGKILGMHTRRQHGCGHHAVSADIIYHALRKLFFS